MVKAFKCAPEATGPVPDSLSYRQGVWWQGEVLVSDLYPFRPAFTNAWLDKLYINSTKREVVRDFETRFNAVKEGLAGGLPERFAFAGGVVENVPAFVASHLKVLEAQGNKRAYEPYLIRLELLIKSNNGIIQREKKPD